MSEKLSFCRSIPVRQHVNVFVAGGGPAGIAAALTAARQGQSVFLAEGHTALGGMGTAGLVPVFMTFSDGINFLADGIGREVLERLQTAGGTGPGSRQAIRAEVLKRVYDSMLLGAGVDFTLQTQLIGVEAASGSVSAAILAAKSGLFAVTADMYIDGTGDGDLAAWAGAPFDKGDGEGDLMPGTLCSLWSSVDWEKRKATGVNVQETLYKAFEAGDVFTTCDPHHPGMWQVGNSVSGGNIGHTFGVDSTDERSLTEALISGRRMMPEFERFYREYIPGFEDLELTATGSLLGVRESRRITGDYVLDVDDFKRRAVFEDEIGRYCYPVDIHPSKPDPTEYAKFEKEFRESLRYKRGESYGIPYRTLTPKGLSNVLVAGRCVSSDRAIQGSIRVMPGCYITGQAAGMAASLAINAQTDTRGIGTGELQAALAGIGAYLPNA
ncbi:MAG: FAD-dependent oxidoreductase [Lentisphaerae bacterium]|jgi:hypothetical protein|nr:FAD-dependent oxidoreductase [Lentisphaerota bacterium]MBT4818402.1 FAD-dependent oxidoreductase [Lentisphaerota bacterium]MBT5610680.1 FAD-dependent oxidoreductase [Lentisphaerota bacterium]MBT7058036.1 FAD-dependent oxidoreductase [Lentisphaerota bacterium]MBT7840658.1 FAD-dependent oxidoreductase [Lentisphaerota bacterium]